MNLPAVTFTSPAIGSVGLTDAQAVPADSGATAESCASNTRRGRSSTAPPATWSKLDTDADADTGCILGVHAVAEAAGEWVAAGVYALSAGITAEQLAKLWCAYLTMAGALELAAQTFTRDVSKLSCCAA